MIFPPAPFTILAFIAQNPPPPFRKGFFSFPGTASNLSETPLGIKPEIFQIGDTSTSGEIAPVLTRCRLCDALSHRTRPVLILLHLRLFA